MVIGVIRHSHVTSDVFERRFPRVNDKPQTEPNCFVVETD